MDLFMPPKADLCRVKFTGGPKDEWVYEYPMHWDLSPDKKTVVMKPPESILVATVGEYVPSGLQEVDGTYLFDWLPASPSPTNSSGSTESTS